MKIVPVVFMSNPIFQDIFVYEVEYLLYLDAGLKKKITKIKCSTKINKNKLSKVPSFFI